MEEFIVKENPLVKIVLFDDSFEIHQPGIPIDIHRYDLKGIDTLQIGKRVNWFVSAFSVVVGFFIGDGGNIYKERDQLKFNYKGKLTVVSLRGGDQKVALRAAERINQYIGKL